MIEKWPFSKGWDTCFPRQRAKRAKEDEPTYPSPNRFIRRDYWVRTAERLCKVDGLITY